MKNQKTSFLSFISKKEQRIRFIWSMLLSTQLLILWLLTFLEISPFPDSSFKAALTDSFTLMIPSLCFNGFFYYCAYKKQGTFLLTLYLFITPFFEVVNILTHCLTPYYKAGFLIFLVDALSVPMYIFSMKLRTINHKIRHLPTIFSKDFDFIRELQRNSKKL